MTLDVHHPSPADVDPLGEGLSARRCRQRASEHDKSQQFHNDVFHLSAFRLQFTCSMSGNFHKSHPECGSSLQQNDAGVWLCEYPGPSFQRCPVRACSLVSSLLLNGATMSQESSLTQSAHFV